MDLRIVNICNNDCLYCLEQSYRKKDKFNNLSYIYDMIKNSNDKVVNFYGGNPILHPNINDIIFYCKNNGYQSIGLLTNTYGLTKELFLDMLKNGLNSIGIYFNSFEKSNHNLIVNGGISYSELINNISFISSYNIYKKIIININNINIKTIYRDIFILKTKYGFENFEFINYFPFDRPYDNRDILQYDIDKNREYIVKIFLTIYKLNLRCYFYKFPKDFFGNYLEFYSFEKGIKNQIGIEDISRLSGKTPFCFKEKRCKYCFIKDNCKFYG